MRLSKTGHPVRKAQSNVTNLIQFFILVTRSGAFREDTVFKVVAESFEVEVHVHSDDRKLPFTYLLRHVFAAQRVCKCSYRTCYLAGLNGGACHHSSVVDINFHGIGY